MRLFVALPVTRAVRDELSDAVAELRERHPGLRWTRQEGWHLTLAFLGQVPDEDVPEVVEVVRAAVHTVPQCLRLGAAGRFGGRVLFVRVEDEPAGTVASLGREVQSALEAVGHDVDRREVRPHLTLARAGRAAIGPAVVDAVDAALGERSGTATGGDGEAGWRPTAIEVWSSHLGRGPARYEVEASIPLDG